MSLLRALLIGAAAFCLIDCGGRESRNVTTVLPGDLSPQKTDASGGFDAVIAAHAVEMMKEGRETFRNDTFGSEAFWGDTLGLHEAIEGSDSVNPGGVSPKTALAVGLKVDAEALPSELVGKIKKGEVNMEDSATTLALLKLNAVVGVRGFFEERGRLRSIGITCAFCHATVDDSFSAGIGRRLDGWPNRDLNVGKIVSLAPRLDPIAKMLQTGVDKVKKVLESWGPGRYDALLDKDGKAFRPDGKTAAVLLPPAYGLAGVNLHTYTGFGSVTYWNAYVANTQMHGQGVFFDDRLKEGGQFPVSARTGSWNTRSSEDRITAKLAGLHIYQLSIPAPKPKAGSFDATAFKRGETLFAGKAKCASCHVPPLYTEPGNNLHSPAEIGIDDFHAGRSPTKSYRTTPLRGLWSHQKGGFYHDGRFATLADVVDHYDRHLKLDLSAAEKNDLIQFLLGL
jgi:hypothetical protein